MSAVLAGVFTDTVEVRVAGKVPLDQVTEREQRIIRRTAARVDDDSTPRGVLTRSRKRLADAETEPAAKSPRLEVLPLVVTIPNEQPQQREISTSPLDQEIVRARQNFETTQEVSEQWVDHGQLDYEPGTPPPQLSERLGAVPQEIRTRARVPRALDTTAPFDGQEEETYGDERMGREEEE